MVSRRRDRNCGNHQLWPHSSLCIFYFILFWQCVLFLLWKQHLEHSLPSLTLLWGSGRDPRQVLVQWTHTRTDTHNKATSELLSVQREWGQMHIPTRVWTACCLRLREHPSRSLDKRVNEWAHTFDAGGDSVCRHYINGHTRRCWAIISFRENNCATAPFVVHMFGTPMQYGQCHADNQGHGKVSVKARSAVLNKVHSPQSSQRFRLII